MEEFETKYYETKAKLQNILENLSVRTYVYNDNSDVFENVSNMKSSNFKLPKINIERFSGDYKDWPSFKDLYVSLVHDNMCLSNIQKFQYLRSLLLSEPANIIKHIPITETAYNEAWEKLLARYDKKKQIIFSLIKTFMEQPSFNDTNSHNLRNIADTSDEVIRGLKSIDTKAESRDVWLIYILLQKVDPKTRQEWAQFSNNIDFPTFEAFIEFLSSRCTYLELYNENVTYEKQPYINKSKFNNSLKCSCCKMNHLVFKCSKFKEMSVKERKQLVNKQKLCMNCLSDRHTESHCNSTFTCHYCKKKHHSLLHDNNFKNYAMSANKSHRAEGQNQTGKDSNQNKEVAVSVNSIQTYFSLLPTLSVNIKNILGENCQVRVMTDSGSESTFISEKCLKLLGLKRKNARFQIKGLQDSKIAMTKGCVEIDLVSLHDPKVKLPVKAYVLEKLTAPLPTKKINEAHFSHLKNACLADPKFFVPNNIDMILGSDYFFSILLPGQITCSQTSASFLATRCIKQIALDDKDNPNLSRVLQEDIYMDDLLSGADTPNNAISICKDIAHVLSTRGFHLRKWNSNSTEFLAQFSEHCSHDTRVEFSKDSNESSKVLGLFWNSSNDTFGFQPSLELTPPLTKRRILSESSKIFDPLGLLSPCTVFMKIFYQKLWLTKTDWDSPIPQQLTENWLKFQKAFKAINYLTVPRWVILTADNTVELHGFADASSLAYAAAIYCRQKHNGKIKVQLLVSKTKVAPVKQVSIPRLELCDIASQGIDPKCLPDCKLWWQGPPWLRLETSSWPKAESSCDEASDEVKAEQKSVSIFNLFTHTSNDVIHRLFEHYSLLTKIIRVFAYCQRFINNCKKIASQGSSISSSHINTTSLTFSETKTAEETIIRWVQGFYFQEEIRSIKKQISLPPKSPLCSLHPFIDEHGLVRVGGRLQNFQIRFNSKHPIILPSQHSISELLIKEQHIAHLHAGPTLLAHVLRQSHWIVGSRKLINKCIRKCLKCNKFKTSTTTPQLMGNLPKHRVTLERPFFSCGIDYAGPVLIKCNKGRGTKSTKGYNALFVCLATKAVHIEAVGDLTTDSFIAHFVVLVLVVGLPATFIVTMEPILLELVENLTKYGNWHFIPPSSPHFGGIWESGIRSVKFHLKRVLGETILTFEELTILLTQIEGLLNSRPLSYVNDSDIECISTLTPSHFLTGDVLLSVPEELPSTSNHRDRWELLQNIKRGFWKKWSSEFISSLQPRKKWQDAQPNLKEDDIVLIKEEGPPGTWPMARVLQVHPGNDGLVRVATVKTQDSVLKRPVHKLHKLPYIRTSSDIGWEYVSYTSHLTVTECDFPILT
ncbi:integrase catalytic domain-containing protein [Trichonephila clavipes]|nr:integrase catalytic domain-containing protein [Trichonephila clavipes]